VFVCIGFVYSPIVASSLDSSTGHENPFELHNFDVADVGKGSSTNGRRAACGHLRRGRFHVGRPSPIRFVDRISSRWSSNPANDPSEFVGRFGGLQFGLGCGLDPVWRASGNRANRQNPSSSLALGLDSLGHPPFFFVFSKRSSFSKALAASLWIAVRLCRNAGVIDRLPLIGIGIRVFASFEGGEQRSPVLNDLLNRSVRL